MSQTESNHNPHFNHTINNTNTNTNTNTNPMSQTISDDQLFFLFRKLSRSSMSDSSFKNNNLRRCNPENVEASLVSHSAFKDEVGFQSRTGRVYKDDVHVRRNTSAKDEDGCPFLQNKIEGVGEDDKDLIFLVIKDAIRDLVVDYTCSGDQKNDILVTLTGGEHVLVKKGTCAIQKLLERLTNEQQQAQIISALTPVTVVLTTDINGHHVIQYCVKHFPIELKEVLIGANSASKEKAQAHVRELEEEVKLLQNLSHPNIVGWLKKSDSKGVKAVSNTSSSWSSQGSKDDAENLYDQWCFSGFQVVTLIKGMAKAVICATSLSPAGGTVSITSDADNANKPEKQAMTSSGPSSSTHRKGMICATSLSPAGGTVSVTSDADNANKPEKQVMTSSGPSSSTHRKGPAASQPHSEERRAQWGGAGTVPFHVVHADLSVFTYQLNLELYNSYAMLERYAKMVIFGVGNAGVPVITYEDFFSNIRRPLGHCDWDEFNPRVMYGRPRGG